MHILFGLKLIDKRIMDKVTDKEKLLRVIVRSKKKRKIKKPDIPRLKVSKLSVEDFMTVLQSLSTLESENKALINDIRRLK